MFCISQHILYNTGSVWDPLVIQMPGNDVYV